MNTPKQFALQLGALVALYVSLGSFITLTFSIINLLLPDAAASYWETVGATDTIRFSLATLVVFFPTYLYLTRTVNQARRDHNEQYIGLTRWLIYLSLLLGGGVLLGDIVAVVYGYLNGDLTARFLLKALVLAIVLGAAFYYYLRDVQSYWQTHEKASIYFGGAATAVMLVVLFYGISFSETPREIRDIRIDDNQITDLQDIQWHVEDYYLLNKKLPETIDSLYMGISLPTAPEGRDAYRYQVTSETTYELCATFAQDSEKSTTYTPTRGLGDKNYNWTHAAGEWCFERVVDTKQ